MGDVISSNDKRQAKPQLSLIRSPYLLIVEGDLHALPQDLLDGEVPRVEDDLLRVLSETLDDVLDAAGDRLRRHVHL